MPLTVQVIKKVCSAFDSHLMQWRDRDAGGMVWKLLHDEASALLTKVDFGTDIKLVGSGPGLGDWDPSKGPSLTWQEGDVWIAKVNVPAGETLKFKVMLGHAATTPNVYLITVGGTPTSQPSLLV